MTPWFLIGIAAGLCAALVFAAAAGGSVPFRAVVVLSTPLPIAVAGLAWGWRAALVATMAGILALGAAASPSFAGAFALTQALPITVLCYLAGLSRTSADPSGNAFLEWYPPGRIVMWSAILGGAIAFGLMLLLGPDIDQLRAAVRVFVEQFAKQQFPELSGGKALSDDEIGELTEIALVVLPAAMAISVMGTQLLNLWLGARLALAAGRLARPWPDLGALAFPPGAPLALAILTAATFASGFIGLAASAFFGALFLAYVLLGLAVIHYVTRGHPWRSFALWGIYGGLVVFNTLASLLIAILGLAETIRPMRQPPPASRSPSQPPPGSEPPAT